VETPWRCIRDGACCTEPADVVMTHAERRTLTAAVLRAAIPGGVTLTFRPHPDPSFVCLVARPCPLYAADAKACRIYEARPFNCRRFACQRRDYAQPYDQGPQTRADRRQLVVIQRHAQRWARSHGWEDGHG
jgi:Fe-S-cluster containining protein